MAGPEPAVRRAVPADAAAIAEVHVRSWKVAYPGLLPQDYLDRLRPEDRRPGWEHRLAAEPWPVVIVAEVAGSVVAFASLAPTEDPDAEAGSVGEVQAFYLEPDRWGTGLADDLMASALDELRGEGFASASLWVLGTNARARRFYERGGWQADGTTKEHDWVEFTATDARYVLPLA